MDIVVAIIVCVIAKILILHMELQQRPIRKRTKEPLGALLFGSGWYWLKAQRPASNKQ